MILKEQLIELLKSDETYRIERTTSTTNVDKFQEAICAFANDLPASHKNGYLLLGVHDDGRLSGLKVDDALMTHVASLRSNGNILPVPMMSVEKFSFSEGDVLVVEVVPSLTPPHRYRGRTFVRIGPRRDIATEAEERVLTERRSSYMATFDSIPCLGAKISDIDVEYVEREFLPKMVDAEILSTDTRNIEEQMASLCLYDLNRDCPTYAAVLLFGHNPRRFVPGAYVQFVRFDGKTNGSDILNERRFEGCLSKMLPTLDSFIRDAIVTERPVPVTVLREKSVFNYPFVALRELMMNACMHRDYQSNMPIRLYQYNDRIEIMNAGGLYGEARPENFPMVNDYRNPIIAEAMKSMKYVNMFNRGIQRVKDALAENGNPEPQFNVNLITVFEVVTKPSIDFSVPDGENKKEQKSATKNVLKNVLKNVPKNIRKKLSERQVIIYGLIKEDPTITISQMSSKMNVTNKTISRDIEKMRSQGIEIVREGSKKGGKWVVSDMADVR